MTASADTTATRRGTASAIQIREHRIPSANSAPYICVEGPDGNLWFCESGAAKIGCFDPRNATFREFPLPAEGATPIGIALGGDGNLVVRAEESQQDRPPDTSGRAHRISGPHRTMPGLTASRSGRTAMSGSRKQK